MTQIKNSFYNTVKFLINLGALGETDVIEKRRIRLLNSFCLVGISFISLFVIINLIVGSPKHALLILSGIPILIIPVLYFNKTRRPGFARFYFIITSLIFINAISYQSILNYENRDNEFFIVGFASIIVVLYDNPLKIFMFLITAFSAIGLKVFRFYVTTGGFEVDNILSLTNMVLALACVYFFTGIFKSDLLSSNERLENFLTTSRAHRKLIREQRDDLENNRYYLRTTLNNIPVFIALMDTTGRFIIVNTRFQEALGMKVNEIEGKNYKEVFDKSIIDLATPLFERSVQGEVTEINHPIVFATGDKIHAFGKYLPLFSEKNEVAGVLAYVTDITELKETEYRLKEINTTKNKILGILSHDLKSPIHALRSLLQISQGLTSDDFIRLIGNVQHKVDSLSFTLDNLLNWVRTQLEGFEAVPEKTSVAQVVLDCLSLYQEQLNSKEIHLDNSTYPEANAFIDPNHLAVVVRNLINNAIKFTPKSGKISISAETKGDLMVLKIEDSGIGMKPSVVDSINDQSASIGSETNIGTEGERGTGMGLAFCKDILSQNQSSLSVESNQGEGTTVKVVMPSEPSGNS